MKNLVASDIGFQCREHLVGNVLTCSSSGLALKKCFVVTEYARFTAVVA
jgi:hypothetical protein